MYKQWGEGDERLLPIYPQYATTIIRWGKEEVEEAIINKNKIDNAKEFLYWDSLILIFQMQWSLPRKHKIPAHPILQ